MPFPDSSRQRRDLLIEALCLTRDIDHLEDALEAFRGRDLPAFENWFAARFARERAAVRELENELNALIDHHNAVIAMAKMHDLTMEKAYRLILKEDRTLDTANEATRLQIEAERRSRREFLRHEMEREFQSRAGAFVNDPGERAAPAVEVNVDQLKSIYRKLARRLHPDLVVPDGDPTARRWRQRYWSMLQDARENGDAFGLTDLDLATRVRQMELAEFDSTTAERARDWFQNDFELRKVEFERARDSAAWDFTLTPEGDVARRVSRELEQDAESLREELRDLREEHEYLKLLGRGARRGGDKGARGEPRSPRPRSSTTQQLSFFD